MEIIEKTKRDLPNATIILVLGILSLVFCWCYGFIGLVLGIVAVVLAGAQRKAYLQSPDEYTEASYKNINSGRICGIIGICLSVVIVVLLILTMVGVAILGAGAAFEGLNNFK